MSHTPSKTDINRRPEQLNPTSSQYYRDRRSSLQDATALVILTQQRFQIEAPI